MVREPWWLPRGRAWAGVLGRVFDRFPGAYDARLRGHRVGHVVAQSLQLSTECSGELVGELAKRTESNSAALSVSRSSVSRRPRRCADHRRLIRALCVSGQLAAAIC